MRSWHGTLLNTPLSSQGSGTFFVTSWILNRSVIFPISLIKVVGHSLITRDKLLLLLHCYELGKYTDLGSVTRHGHCINPMPLYGIMSSGEARQPFPVLAGSFRARFHAFVGTELFHRLSWMFGRSLYISSKRRVRMPETLTLLLVHSYPFLTVILSSFQCDCYRKLRS